MKWGIIILLILGVVAAISAAMLIGTLRAESSTNGKKSLAVEVARAKRSLPAMTVMTLDNVITEKVPMNDLPEGRLVRPAQAIGKVLAVPVVEGQVLTDSCFVTEGTGALLAASLPHGMRAVTVTLSAKTIPDSLLLYPGCVVDVLVSFKLSLGSRSDEQAISTTMLRGIQVLAVAGDSVVAAPKDKAESVAKPDRTNHVATVTLMVDPKQAEALQLASDNGSIALAIRNPLDRNKVATVLSQGRLANSGSALAPAVLAAVQMEQETSAEQAQGDISFDKNVPVQQPKPDEEYEIRQSQRWGITVIRGRETKFEQLAIPESVSTSEANRRR